MFFAGLLLMLLSFVCGWFLAGLSHSGRLIRGFQAPLLGLGLYTSTFAFCDRIVPGAAGWALTSAVLMTATFWAYKQDSKAPHFQLKKAQVVLITILAFSSWFFALGMLQLNPSDQFLIWELTNNEPGARTALMACASLFAKDQWLGALLFLGLAQVAIVLGAFSIFRKSLPEANLPWLVAALYTLGSGSSAWLTFLEPQEVLIHLWALTTFLVFGLKPKERWLAIPTLAALLLEAWGTAGVLLVSILPLKLQQRRFVAITIFLTFLWFHGFHLGSLAALAGLLYQKSHPTCVKMCFLGLLHPSLGLAAIATEITVRWEEHWIEKQPGAFSANYQGLTLPKKFALLLLAIFMFWKGIDGAETVLNDKVLIGAQKKGVSHTKLLIPRTLESWLELRGTDFSLPEDVRQLVDRVSKLDGTFVYLSKGIPDPRASSLLAVASHKPFRGWSKSEGNPALLGPFALYLFTGDPQTLAGSAAKWLVKEGEEELALPEQSQTTSTVAAAEVQIEDKPVAIEAPLVAQVDNSQAREIPAAALVPITLSLKNPTNHRLDLSRYLGVQVQPTFGDRKPLAPIEQPVAGVTLTALEPGQSTEIKAYLRTSNNPLHYKLGIVLTKADGTYDLVPLEEPFTMRSWRTALPIDQAYGEVP